MVLSLAKLRAMKKPNLGKSEEHMKKSALEQAKELLKSIQENPKGIEELTKNSHIKGVHTPIGTGNQGVSQMGKILS